VRPGRSFSFPSSQSRNADGRYGRCFLPGGVVGKDTARLYNCKRVCFRKDRKLALTACQRGPVVVRAFLVLHEREDGRDKDGGEASTRRSDAALLARQEELASAVSSRASPPPLPCHPHAFNSARYMRAWLYGFAVAISRSSLFLVCQPPAVPPWRSAPCRLACRCLVGSGRLPIPCAEAAGPLHEYDVSHSYMRR